MDEVDPRLMEPILPKPKTLSLVQTLAMCLCILTESAQVTMPYTVAVYMVRDFLGPSGDQQLISRLTGILAAVFMAAQFLTSYPWGLVSDRYGRKKLVILGNFFTTLGIILFGLSPSYLSACAARFLGGFFNCSYMNIRSMIGESTDAATQGLVMGYVSLAWGLGTVLGPTMGGGLATPCEKWWFTFLCEEGQLFNVRPFLLPCLALAVISFTATVSSTVFLRETLPSFQVRDDAAVHLSRVAVAQAGALPPSKPLALPDSPFLQSNGGEGSNRRESKESWGSVRSVTMSGLPPLSPVTSLSASTPRHIPPTPADRIPWLEMGSPSALVGNVSPSVDRALASRIVRSSSSLTRRPSFLDAGLWTRQGMGLPSSQSSSSMQQQGQPPTSPGPPETSRAREGWRQEGVGESSPRALASPSLSLPDAEQPSASVPLLQHQQSRASPSQSIHWWQDSQVLRTIFGYGTVCFLYNLLDELVPIFSAAPVDAGGLDLSASELSAPLSMSGVALMVWALLGYPLMQHYLGPTGMIKFGLLLTAPMAMAVPLCSLFATRSKQAARVALTVALSLKNVGQNNSFSSSSILVNLLATPAFVGAINGASQTLASFVRAVGPALGGYVWAFSLDWGIGHQYAPFAMASLVAISGAALYYGLHLPQREVIYDIHDPAFEA